MQRSDLPSMTSASQLSTYANCPRRYAYRYVERREPEHRTPGLALGSAVHSALGWWFAERAAGQAPSVVDAARIVRADLAAALATDNYTWKKDTPESIADEAERLLTTFISAHGRLDVLRAELPFDLLIIDPDTGEEMPRVLIGYLDFELADGNYVELKTAKRAYSGGDLRVGLQFAAYRTAARYAGVDVELYAIIRNKTPRIQHVVLPHDRTVSEWFMRAAAHIERAIMSGQFPPSPGMMCSSCEYRRACLGVEAEISNAAA